MFQTPASRARRLRRRAAVDSGPVTHNLAAHMLAGVVMSSPFVQGDDLDAVNYLAAMAMAVDVEVARNTSYANEGGTGNRTALIDVFFNQSITGGGTTFVDITNAVDGAFGDDTTDSWYMTSGNNTVTPPELFIDFRPSGYFQVIDEIKWYQDTSTTHGTWVVEGFDGYDWYTLKSGFTLGGNPQTITLDTNIGEYMFYRLRGTAGSRSSSPWLREIEFKIARGSPIPVFGTNYADAVSVGNRAALISISTGFTNGGGAIGDLIDGAQTDSYWLDYAQSGEAIKFDFTAVGDVRIDELKWYQSNTTVHGWWRWEGSDDDVTYVELSNWFQLFGPPGGGSITVNAMRNVPRAFPYYRLRHVVDSVSGSPYIREIEFKARTGDTLHQLTAHMVAATFAEVESIVDGDDPTLFWETGDRRGDITISSNYQDGATSLFIQQLISGSEIPSTPEFMINGNTGVENRAFRGAHTDGHLKFDFGSGRIMQGFRWYQLYFPTTGGDGNHGSYQWYGSNDDASYTAIGNAFHLTSAPGGMREINEPFGNTTSYQYYRLTPVTASTKKNDNTTNYNPLYVSEIEFYIDPA